MTGPEPDIRITWNIHWACNYRCSYCFFDKHWKEYGKRNVHKSLEEWMDCWKRLRERHGRAFVTVTGGEPFAYPDFVELMRRLSDIHWPINISTNTSIHLEEYARAVDHSKVSLSLSFHPQYQLIEEFVDKVRFLKRAGARLGCLNFTAYPPFLKDLPRYVRALEDVGEGLKTIPYVGELRGRKYPEGYDAKEKELLGLDGGWVDSKRREGALCPAGQRAALLLPDGNLTRCGQIGDDGVFASFFDPDFHLLYKPMPCAAKLCPCDEWKVIPDEKAPEKGGAWLP